MPTTEIIRIDYGISDLGLELDLNLSCLNHPIVKGNSALVARDDESLIPKILDKKLEHSAYRAILKKNKTKIIKDKSDLALVREWRP